MEISNVQNLPYNYLDCENKRIISQVYTPSYDIFELSDEFGNDYASFLRLARKKSPKTEQRYKELYLKKNLIISPQEAFILACKHTLNEIFKFCEDDEVYDIEDFEDKHYQIAQNYALNCSNRGYELSNQDVENCLRFGENPTTGTINLAHGLKYVGLLNGYAPLKMPLNQSEAKWFIGQSSNIKEINAYLNFIKRNPKLKEILDIESALNSEFEIHPIQETKDYQIVSTRTYTDSKGCEIENFKILEKDGVVENSTTTTNDGYIISRKNNSRIINMTNDDIDFYDAGNIINNYDIILAQDEKPISIIQTKLSEDLDFAYTTKEFYIANPEETIDAKEIVNICNGEADNVFTNIRKNDDGSIDYEQFYDYGDTRFQSYYYQNEDNSENIYTINIQDKGKEILNHNKSFEKIDKNTTLTKINGKKYITKFDDENITILTDGKTIKFKITDYFSSEQDIKNNIDFIKTIPADMLISIYKCKCRVIIDNEIEGGYFDTLNICTSENISFLAHELGHAIDFKLGKNKNDYISQNEELKKTYEEELQNYRKLFPYRTQSMAINYFTKTGIKNYTENKIINTGLSEIVAEANALLVLYATKDKATQFRSNTLLKYFPKTIALAAKLLKEKINS